MTIAPPRHLNFSSYRKASLMSLVTKYTISTFVTEEKIIKSVALRREHYNENGGSNASRALLICL